MKTTNLKVGYGRKVVLDGLNLELAPGDLTVLIGANGSGKSTLLRTITGLQPPLAGEVNIGGKRLDSLPARELAKHLSIVLTDRNGGGGLRVRELVAVGRHPYSGYMGGMSTADNEAVDAAVAAVGLGHKASDFVSSLSDGERQKAMIARALAQNTRIIVLDEPTSFLDVSARFDIMNLLGDIAAGGKAILLSTHDIASALTVADTVWAIPGGAHTVRAIRPTDPDFAVVMDAVYPSATFVPELSDYRPR